MTWLTILRSRIAQGAALALALLAGLAAYGRTKRLQGREDAAQKAAKQSLTTIRKVREYERDAETQDDVELIRRLTRRD